MKDPDESNSLKVVYENSDTWGFDAAAAWCSLINGS